MNLPACNGHKFGTQITSAGHILVEGHRGRLKSSSTPSLLRVVIISYQPMPPSRCKPLKRVKLISASTILAVKMRYAILCMSNWGYSFEI